MLCVAKRIVIAAVAVVSLPLAARAGIADSPLPAGFTVHVYSVSGVINNAGYGTYFSCTNVDAVPVAIGVEVFGPAGGAPANNASTTAINVAPGATVMFGTQAANSLSLDAGLSVGIVTKGSARVLATSKKIICTALLVDPGSNPAVSMTYLTIVAKTKQKAAN